MASIRDYNVVEQFNSRLQEIRTKLLDQAMGEVLNDRAAELCQDHRQYMKSVLGERSTGLCCGCHHGLSLDVQDVNYLAVLSIYIKSRLGGMAKTIIL